MKCLEDIEPNLLTVYRKGEHMGLKETISNIFNFKEKDKSNNDLTYAKMLNGQLPIFSQFGNNIYASDVVLQCIYAIIDEMTKLEPKHIRKTGYDYIPVEGDIQSVLDDPNPLMTFPDFMSKFMFNLLVNENSFVYKKYENDKLVALYPLNPTRVTFLETADSKLYIEFEFSNGYKSTVPYDLVIHQKNHFTVNDLMGGNEFGQPNNEPILDTVRLYDTLLQGLRKALNISFAINGIVKYNTMLDDGKMEKAIKDFENKLNSSDSGILGMDNKAEIIQFKRDIKLIDEAMLKFIDDKILRNWKTPIEILRGNADTEVLESWYQLCLEPYIIRISKTFTKSIFTKREATGFKNEIKLFPKELIFANIQDTIAMVNLLAPTGTLYENEKRVSFGFAPLKELEGKRLQSLNWVDVEFAKEYQLKTKNKEEKEVQK